MRSVSPLAALQCTLHHHGPAEVRILSQNLSPAFLFPVARDSDKWKFRIDYKWLHQRTNSGGTKLNGEWILGIFKCRDVESNCRHLPQPEAELISMCVIPSSNISISWWLIKYIVYCWKYIFPIQYFNQNVAACCYYLSRYYYGYVS